MSTENLIKKIGDKIADYDNLATNIHSTDSVKAMLEKEELEVYQSLLEEANKYLDRNNPVDRFLLTQLYVSRKEIVDYIVRTFPKKEDNQGQNFDRLCNRLVCSFCSQFDYDSIYWLAEETLKTGADTQDEVDKHTFALIFMTALQNSRKQPRDKKLFDELALKAQPFLISIGAIEIDTLIGRVPLVRIDPKVMLQPREGENVCHGRHSHDTGIVTVINRNEKFTIKHELSHLIWRATKQNKNYQGHTPEDKAIDVFMNIFKNEMSAYSTTPKDLLGINSILYLGLDTDRPLFNINPDRWDEMCENFGAKVRAFNQFVNDIFTVNQLGCQDIHQPWRIKVLKLVHKISNLDDIYSTAAQWEEAYNNLQD